MLVEGSLTGFPHQRSALPLEPRHVIHNPPLTTGTDRPTGAPDDRSPSALILPMAYTTDHLPSSLTPHAIPTPLRSSNKLNLSLHHV